MLGENIKNCRMAKGLSQEALANQCHVVRQTVSKWEKGRSVPDADMLLRLAEALDTTVNQLLGATDEPSEVADLLACAAKSERFNEQSAQRNEHRRSRRIVFAVLGVTALLLAGKELLDSIWVWHAMHAIHADASVIGGLDSSTNLYVTSGIFQIGRILFPALIAVASGIGFYQTRRK